MTFGENVLKLAVTVYFGHLGAAETSGEHNTNILPIFLVDMLNCLANSHLFTCPVGTEQH